MSVTSVIDSLKPIAQSALDVIKAFTGTPQQASSDSRIGDAMDILKAAIPLIDDWAHGMDITQDDVEAAFVDMDSARDAFRAEIAKQQAAG